MYELNANKIVTYFDVALVSFSRRQVSWRKCEKYILC